MRYVFQGVGYARLTMTNGVPLGAQIENRHIVQDVLCLYLYFLDICDSKLHRHIYFALRSKY